MIEYRFAVSQIAKSAYPRMPQDFREELAVDKFIKGLPNTEMKQHVQFGHPKSIDRAVALAFEFESFRREAKTEESETSKQTKGGTCEDSLANFFMKGMEEMVKKVQQLEDRFDKLVGEKSNKSESIQNEISAPSTFIQGLICDNCFAEGHKERQCQNPRASRAPLREFLPGVWCHRCKYEGHVEKVCPNPRSRQRSPPHQE